MNQSWFQERERGSPWTVRLICWIALHLGRPTARLFLYPITLYFLLMATGPRRASQSYLPRVLHRQPHLWHLAKHIHCFAATILDRVFLLKGQFEQFEVNIHHGTLVQEQFDKKQGCILLGSHLGSFEILRTLAVTQQHFALKVLMYKDHNPFITQLLETLNPNVAETVINLGHPGALLQVSDSLAQGELIGILGDRIAENDKVTSCQFLGSTVTFPAGPMLLAAVLKVPVILFFGLYRGGNRYDIYFEKFAEQVVINRQQRYEDVQYWTQLYAARLEEYLRNAPYNWFNFYDYWQD